MSGPLTDLSRYNIQSRINVAERTLNLLQQARHPIEPYRIKDTIKKVEKLREEILSDPSAFHFKEQIEALDRKIEYLNQHIEYENAINQLEELLNPFEQPGFSPPPPQFDETIKQVEEVREQLLSHPHSLHFGQRLEALNRKIEHLKKWHNEYEFRSDYELARRIEEQGLQEVESRQERDLQEAEDRALAQRLQAEEGVPGWALEPENISFPDSSSSRASSSSSSSSCSSAEASKPPGFPYRRPPPVEVVETPSYVSVFKELLDKQDLNTRSTTQKLKMLKNKHHFLISGDQELEEGNVIYGHLYRIHVQAGKVGLKDPNLLYTEDAFHDPKGCKERSRALRCAHVEITLRHLEKAVNAPRLKMAPVRFFLEQLQSISLDEQDYPKTGGDFLYLYNKDKVPLHASPAFFLYKTYGWILYKKNKQEKNIRVECLPQLAHNALFEPQEEVSDSIDKKSFLKAIDQLKTHLREVWGIKEPEKAPPS